MKVSDDERLFTKTELLIYAVIAVVYSAVLFSLDPEWVAWAAPLAFGGSLCAQDPPPASAHLGSPQDVLPLAYVYSVLSLLALALVPLVRSKPNWLSWLANLKGIARVRNYLTSRS